MPRENTFLFILPHQHHLIYGSSVAKEIIEANRKPNMDITILEGDRANPSEIDKAIMEKDPIFVFAIGHGEPDSWTCECTELYMKVGDERTRYFAYRIVHLNSCYTAQALGPELVRKGALAYFGSKDAFWFYIGDPPCTSRASKAAFLCEHQVIASLMNGKTVLEAHRDRLRRFDEEIDYWTIGIGRNHPHATIIARILEINKNIAVALGIEEFRTVPLVAPFIVGIVNLFRFLVGVGLIAWGLWRKRE